MAEYLIPSLGGHAEPPGAATNAKRFFLESLARKTGFALVRDARLSPPGDAALYQQLARAQKLISAGIASSFGRSRAFPDEPPIRAWSVAIQDANKSGGLSVRNDAEALRAAVSEALERHIWMHEQDWLAGRVTAPYRDLGARAIDPLRFAGYSDAQRLSGGARLAITPDTPFAWIDGYSETRKDRVYIPAQVVSGAYQRSIRSAQKEPIILESITTGLATHQTVAEAVLGGALEVFERDAFMIQWLNRLSLPRLDPQALADRSPRLAELLARTKHYGLSVHFVHFVTDAPAHCIMAVVRDPRMMTPVEVGLSAHTRITHACEKALLEALRARTNARMRIRELTKPFVKRASEVNFSERHLYWADPARAHLLDFLTAGEVVAPLEASWEEDGPEEHLERIISWCREKEYELAYVDLSPSAKNVLGLHIVFVVIPEMQPLYLDERRRYEGGERLKSVPRLFGHEPRATLYTEEPHPFV